MQVKIEQKEVSVGRVYPRLMMSNDKMGFPGQLVLFISDGTGIVLKLGVGQKDFRVGEYWELFAMEVFEDFIGDVTLSND